MMQRRLPMIAAVLALAATVGCAKTDLSPRGGSPTSDKILVEPTAGGLVVVDPSGNPVGGARIMIGMRQGVPFPDNVLTTDKSGAVILPEKWTEPQPITIEARGYIRTTYFDRLPTEARLVIKRVVTDERIQLNGQTKGFGDLKSDGMVDVGLIFPAVTRSQASLIAVSDLMSPEADTMTVLGQKVEIPSNVTVPTQRETYVLPVTLSKPQYRYFFKERGNYNVAAIHARFPIKAMADGSRAGKSIFELINFFTFVQASTTQIPMRTAKSVDLAVNSVTFSPEIQISAPAFNPKLKMLSVALANDGGLFYATDVKRIEPRESRTLTAPKAGLSKGLVVSLLTAGDLSYESTLGAASDQISTVTSPANASQSIDFLPLIDPPSLRSGTLVLNPPKKSKRISGEMTYGVLSKVEVIQKGEIKFEKKTPQWELYANDWPTSMELPQLPSLMKSKGPLRWEVTFAGGLGGTMQGPAGPEQLEKVSHVTRSAVDL